MINKLKLARQNRQLKQWQVSQMTSIPENRICLFETNRVKPHAFEKKKLATALGASEEELF